MDIPSYFLLHKKYFTITCLRLMIQSNHYLLPKRNAKSQTIVILSIVIIYCFTSVKVKNKFDVSYVRREGAKLLRKSEQFVLIFSCFQILTS